MLGRKNRMAICSLLMMVVFVAMSSLAWAWPNEDADTGILGRLQELKERAENAIGEFKANIEGIVDGATTGAVLGSVKEDLAGIKDTIVDNIAGSDNSVLGSFAGAVTGGNGLASVSAADVPVVESIPESVQSASLLTMFGPVLDSLDPFLKGLVGVAGPLLQPLLEPVMGLLMGGMELLAPVLGPVLNTVMGIATPLLGPVMGLLMGGMGLLEPILAPIMKLAQPLLDMLGSALGSVMGVFAPSSEASAAPEPSQPTEAKSAPAPAPAPAPTSTEVVQAPRGSIPVSSRPFAALPFTGANLLAMALLILVIAGCAVGLWKLERVLAKS